MLQRPILTRIPWQMVIATPFFFRAAYNTLQPLLRESLGTSLPGINPRTDAEQEEPRPGLDAALVLDELPAVDTMDSS